MGYAKQGPTTLVSNTGQSPPSLGVGAGAQNFDHAQAFTTGASNYVLTAVRVQLALIGTATAPTLTASLCPDSSGAPSSSNCETLTVPSPLAEGTVTLSAAGAGINLDPSTTYWLVLDTTSAGTGSANWSATGSGNEDSGAATGWSIANSRRSRAFAVTAWNDPHNEPVKIAVVGAVASDYDSDDDGLIEISSADQLNAVRWDPDGDGTPATANQSDYAAAFPFGGTGMGCPSSGCIGYELTADISLADYQAGNGWVPIGDSTTQFSGTFDGNGHRVTQLSVTPGVDSPGTDFGLFGVIGDGVVRNLEIVAPNIDFNDTNDTTNGPSLGALAGSVTVTGKVRGVFVNGGTVKSRVAPTGTGKWLFAGGLVGRAVRNSSIANSYSTAAVSTTVAGSNYNVGGLVGTVRAHATLVNTYAAGSVSASTSTNDLGGLIGRLQVNAANTAPITASYYDGAVSGRSDTGKGESKTTAELQSPTGYTGIYATWINNPDGGRSTDPWNFGTASEYPTLNVPGPIDYDFDGDGLIEIYTAAELNAMRLDRNGDGLTTTADQDDYDAAFPNPVAGMGCPAGGCKGYEIGTGATGETAIEIDLGVAPWNTSPNWVPIPGFATTFEGNGHTITGLTINQSGNTAGLFHTITSAGEVRNLKLTTVSVSAFIQVGALAGINGGRVRAVSVSGGTVAGSATLSFEVGGLVGDNAATGRIIASSANVTVTRHSTLLNNNAGGGAGGLAGRNQGVIQASFARGSVMSTSGGSSTQNNFATGGLVGRNQGSTASIEQSYSTGAVTVDSGHAGGLVGLGLQNATVLQRQLLRLHQDGPQRHRQGRGQDHLRAPDAHELHRHLRELGPGPEPAAGQQPVGLRHQQRIPDAGVRSRRSARGRHAHGLRLRRRRPDRHRQRGQAQRRPLGPRRYRRPLRRRLRQLSRRLPQRPRRHGLPRGGLHRL